MSYLNDPGLDRFIVREYGTRPTRPYMVPWPEAMRHVLDAKILAIPYVRDAYEDEALELAAAELNRTPTSEDVHREELAVTSALAIARMIHNAQQAGQSAACALIGRYQHLLLGQAAEQQAAS